MFEYSFMNYMWKLAVLTFRDSFTENTPITIKSAWEKSSRYLHIFHEQIRNSYDKWAINWWLLFDSRWSRCPTVRVVTRREWTQSLTIDSARRSAAVQGGGGGDRDGDAIAGTTRGCESFLDADLTPLNWPYKRSSVHVHSCLLLLDYLFCQVLFCYFATYWLWARQFLPIKIDQGLKIRVHQCQAGILHYRCLHGRPCIL